MSKPLSKENTPRAEKLSQKGQKNEEQSPDGSFLGQPWQKSDNVTEEDAKSKGMPFSISMLKDKSDVSLKLDLSEIKLPLHTVALTQENESPLGSKGRASTGRASGNRSPSKHPIPYTQLRRELSQGRMGLSPRGKVEDHPDDNEEEKPISFVKRMEVETRIIESEEKLPENVPDRRVVGKRVTLEKPLDIDKFEIQRKISNAKKVSSLGNVGESPSPKEKLIASQPNLTLKRGKSYVEEKTVKKVITEIIPSKKVRLTPMHARENFYLSSEQDKEFFREDQRRIASQRREEYARRSKGMLREIEITEVMRTKLEAALIIQRWFRQLKESRRTSLLNKPPDQLAQASDQQAQDELKRSAGKKRESSASINSRDDPQNKKNVLITPYDTATFASPMSMSKITSPRTGADANTSELEEEPRQMPIPSSNHPNASEDGRVQETGGLLNRTSPEKEETISKRTAEKLKSKELSPEQRLEKEKEKNQSAKEKLKLLREAEMKAAITIQRKFRDWRKTHPSKFKNISVQADTMANPFDESLLYTEEFNTFCKALSQNPVFQSALSYQWLFLYFRKRLAQGVKEAGPKADVNEIMKKILKGMPVTEDQERRMAIMMEQRYQALRNSKTKK